MENYLISNEIQNNEEMFIYACQSGDLDLKGCKPWFHENTTCIGRKSKKILIYY